MKKIIIPIIFLISFGIVSFVLITKANYISKEEAFKIGEEKYLKFLWMVDGAFNSERLDNDYIVNNKKLSDSDKIFTCKYETKNKEECIGNNFEEEFKKLFSSQIRYDDVYSDGYTFAWYKYEDNKFIFNNMISCNINRMGINHKLVLKNIKEDKLLFEVSFQNEQIDYEYKKEFILVKEDNEWKINKAYYYDLCGMKYNIK